MVGGAAQCCKYQIHSQKMLYRKVQVCCLRVVFVTALTPKEPPCNRLRGEEKRVRTAKALLRNEMDCWKSHRLRTAGDLGGTECATDHSRKGTEGEGYGSVKAQISGEDGQLTLTPYAP